MCIFNPQIPAHSITGDILNIDSKYVWKVDKHRHDLNHSLFMTVDSTITSENKFLIINNVFVTQELEIPSLNP